jgi:hypothetical protein
MARNLPGVIIFVALLHDLVSSVSLPKFVRAVFRWLSSPFRNFLTLEDLLDPVDLTLRYSKAKNRFLVGLASILFVSWMGYLIFSVYLDNHGNAVKPMIQSVSWVSSLNEKKFLVVYPGRVLVLYRSKIELQTLFDAAIPFYYLCDEFFLGFFCGFRARHLACQLQKCRCRRPCNDRPRNFCMAGGYVAIKALPALS